MKKRQSTPDKAHVSSRQAAAPLILLVNDDGIKSPGLLALAQGMSGIGELLIVAPEKQQTSMGRALAGTGRTTAVDYRVAGRKVAAYAVAGSPALAVRVALFGVAKRRPALIVSGINYGENVGSGLTASGTIGAAIEGAADGLAALAISRATLPEFNKSYSDSIDFRAAAHFARLFALLVLKAGLPAGAEVLNINVPEGASERTPWRWTRPGRSSYYRSIVRIGKRGPFLAGTEVYVNPATLRPDWDIQATAVDRVVSVSPLRFDLAAEIQPRELARWERR